MGIPTRLKPSPPLEATPENLERGFEQELLTDWIPDAIGGADAKALCREMRAYGDLNKLTLDLLVDDVVIPLRTREERIPIIDALSRAMLHCAIEMLVTACNLQLMATVCGYRDCATPYQVEFRRRLELSRHFGERATHVALMDIARFSQSIDEAKIDRLSWMRPEVRTLLTQLYSRVGRYFLPGDHWGCRLGTCLLDEFDRLALSELGEEWLRWLDDIHVFTASQSAASDAIEQVTTELRDRGFAVNESKVRILGADDYLELFAAKPRELDSIDHQTAWAEGVAEGDRQKLRYAIRRLAYDQDPTAIATCVATVERFPDLLPRAIHYLSTFPNEGPTATAIAKLSAREDDFTTAWLMAAGVAVPSMTPLLGLDVIRRGSQSDSASVRGLAWRLQRRTGNPTTEVANRLQLWAARGGDDYGDPPVIDSNI